MERLYQVVIAQSVEPRHIFVSIKGEGSNPTLFLFFVKQIFFKYHYCLKRLFIIFLLYFKCF